MRPSRLGSSPETRRTERVTNEPHSPRVLELLGLYPVERDLSDAIPEVQALHNDPKMQSHQGRPSRAVFEVFMRDLLGVEFMRITHHPDGHARGPAMIDMLRENVARSYPRETTVLLARNEWRARPNYSDIAEALAHARTDGACQFLVDVVRRPLPGEHLRGAISGLRLYRKKEVVACLEGALTGDWALHAFDSLSIIYGVRREQAIQVMRHREPYTEIEARGVVREMERRSKVSLE